MHVNTAKESFWRPLQLCRRLRCKQCHDSCRLPLPQRTNTPAVRAQLLCAGRGLKIVVTQEGDIIVLAMQALPYKKPHLQASIVAS